jgi:hypothetical protein
MIPAGNFSFLRMPRLRGWITHNSVWVSLLIYTSIIIVTTLPTADVYMWWGHYMLFPVVDVYEICKIWSAGGFGHVPWFPDYCFGYGYPYLTLYGPLGFYIGSIFHFLLGLDYGPATKLSFYASLYLSGLFVYAFVYTMGSRERWPRLAWWSLAAATVYALTRYHLTDVFVRSVMGESWAWATLAGVYWGMELTRHRRLQGLLVTSVMYAGLLLSHNITALWASLFIAIYPLLIAKDLKFPLTVAGGGLLGTAMSAFFWYPAVTLAKYTLKAGNAATMWGTPQLMHQQSIFWRQHFLEALGYGNTRFPGTESALGINIGFAVLIGVMLSAVGLFQRGLRGAQRQRLALFILLTFLVLFIMSPQMPWGRVPAIFRYLQFPWRLLIFTAFFGAGAVAMASPVIDRWIHPAILTGLAVIFAIPTLPMILMPPVIKQMPPERLVKWNHRWERKGIYAGTAEAEFTPKWVHGDYLKPLFLAENPIPANRLTTTSGDIVCDSFMHRGCVYEYNYKASVDSAARIAVFYWPGWELLIDGKVYRDSVKPGDDGLLLASFPAGSHRAELHYNLSPEGKSARMISIAAAGLWVCILFAAMFLGRKESSKIAPTTDDDENRKPAREDAVGSSAAVPPDASA